MEIKNSADLRAAILDLEDKSKREKQQLIEDFHVFKESLAPINLIKSTIKKVKETPGITGIVLKTSLGLGVGLLSKRLLVGKSAGILKRIIGSAIEMGVAGLVAKKTDNIKETGFQLFKNFFRSKKR
ncbi:MAG: hypothetical protein ABI760_11025 [Ferruginibacter sp.]